MLIDLGLVLHGTEPGSQVPGSVAFDPLLVGFGRLGDNQCLQSLVPPVERFVDFFLNVGKSFQVFIIYLEG